MLTGRLEEVAAGHDRYVGKIELPEAGHRRADHGPGGGEVLVDLDGVEAVGELGDDVRHHEHVGVLEVRRDRGVLAGAEQDSAGAGEPGLVGGVQGHGTDQDEGRRPEQAGGQRGTEVHVEPVAVQRADVEDHRTGRQVVGPWRVGQVGVDVHGVRDQRHPLRPPRGLGLQQPGRADDHLAAVVEEVALALDEPVVLARRAVGQQPVVGDVVERGPAGPAQEVGGQGVVEPQRGPGHAHLPGRPQDGGRQPLGRPPGRACGAATWWVGTARAGRRPGGARGRGGRPTGDGRRAAGRRAARRTARGGRGRPPAVARPGAGCVARPRPRPRARRRPGPSQQPPVDGVGTAGLLLHGEPFALDDLEPGAVRLPLLLASRPAHAADARRRRRRPARTARLRARSPPSRGGRPSPPPRPGGRAPSPPPRTGRTPRRCAAPAARRPRASAPTCPGGGRGTPRRRRGRSDAARSSSSPRSAPSPAMVSRQPASARPDAAKARTATSVCFSRSSRCATRTTGCRSTAATRSGSGRTPLSTTVLAPSTWSATYCDTAIWPSTRRVPQRVTGRVRRRVPRGEAKWRVLTTGTPRSHGAEREDHLGRGHVHVDHVGTSRQPAQAAQGDVDRVAGEDGDAVSRGGPDAGLVTAHDRHPVPQRRPGRPRAR